MTVLYFNHGFSSIADAIVMIREGAAEAAPAVIPSLKIIASHRDPQAPSLAVADVAIPEPHHEMPDDEYLNWCVDICRTHAVGYFFAQTRRMMLSAHSERFAAVGTTLCVPADARTLGLIEDKARFYDAATAAGLPMGWTRVVSELAGFDSALADLKSRNLKACIKPPEGVFGHGFWRLVDGKTLMATVINPADYRIGTDVVRDALDQSDGTTRLLVMETLDGDEWSVDCVCRNGDFIAGVSRRKLGREQLLGAEGPEFDIARRAVAAMNLSGLVNVQCKAALADHSDLRLLEINTRMSGGCAWTRHAGVNLPWLMVASAMGILDHDSIPTARGGMRIATRTESFVTGHNAPVLEGDVACVI